MFLNQKSPSWSLDSSYRRCTTTNIEEMILSVVFKVNVPIIQTIETDQSFFRI